MPAPGLMKFKQRRRAAGESQWVRGYVPHAACPCCRQDIIACRVLTPPTPLFKTVQYISDGEAIEVGVIDPDDEEETYRREQALVPRPVAGSELQFRVISGYILRGSGGDICILAIL